MTLSETEWNEEAPGSGDLGQGKHDTNQKTAIIKTPITSDPAAPAAPTTITYKREQRRATLNHLLTLRHLQTTMTATKWAGSAAALGASLSPRRVALHKQKCARERERERQKDSCNAPASCFSLSHARWTYIRIRALHCTYVYTWCNHTYT
jgi:hypothetical protein